MALDPTPDELKDFKILEKVLISKMDGKGKFFKIQGSI